MAHEIEIKLRASSKALKAVAKLDWLMALAQAPPKRKKLRSVYFDTSARALQQRGLTLRVRHSGRNRLQTVKANSAGVFARHEWECDIKGDKPDLTALPQAARKRLGKLERLRPVFETAVTRTTITLLYDGTAIELALDAGVIKARRRSEPISEIELEWKDGDPAGLAALAERLAADIAVSFECRAKSERGYGLASGTRSRAVHAQDIELNGDMTVAEAYRAIAMECLRHLSSNESAVLAGDAEGVHQMRVGLRRLRAAMSLMREMLSDSQSQAIRTELKWLTEQLGPARDIDVFVRDSLAPLAKAARGMTVLKKDMERQRDEAFTRARMAVADERYRRLVLAVALWLANGNWGSSEDLLQSAHRERPIRSFANETLTTRTRKVLKKTRKLQSLQPRARHRLRIAAKKLRYAAEFFAMLYDGKKAKARQQKMSANLEALQEALGRLNDFAVHQKMAGKVIAAPTEGSPKEAYGFGIVTGHELSESEGFLAAARKAGARLKAKKPFWT
ncbi:MAG: CHAD domain-containing protein [Rhizomicrobium sp.]|nr:CHAD domain-containing protein [Rhizomicrobium sp.]